MYISGDRISPIRPSYSIWEWRQINLRLSDDLSIMVDPEELQHLAALLLAARDGYNAWLDDGRPADMTAKRHQVDFPEDD